MPKSDENRASCLYDKGKFQSVFKGTETEIITAVKIIEMRFSETLLQCLSPKLQEIYNGWVFTRETLETRFLQKICDEVDEMSVAIRKNILYDLAKEGNIIPLVEFVMAFEFGEGFIWFEIATVVACIVRTDKQSKFVSKKLAPWKKVTKELFKTSVYDFVSDFENEGIWHYQREMVATSVEEYPHLVFKWDGSSSIHVIKDKSLLSNYRSDTICPPIEAYNWKTLKGAGDMKDHLADGSVGILRDMFHDEELNANLLSTNLLTPFYHGIVDNKLIRLDTGKTIGYLRNGTSEVQVEIPRQPQVCQD